MPIGTSVGTYHEDDASFAAGVEDLKQPVEKAAEASSGRPRVYIRPEDNNAPVTSVEAPAAPTEDVHPEPYGLNPPDRETPFPRPRASSILEGVWDSAKKAFTLPGKVSQGLIDPGSVQAIEQSADLAGFMVMGPAPIAGKIADGTLGSFAGVKAKTLDKTRLYEAQNLATEGVHPDEVYKQTGFFRSADGRWRHEIDDSKSNILDKGTVLNPAIESSGWTTIGKDETIKVKEPRTKPLPSDKELLAMHPDDFLKTVTATEPHTLQDVLHHPELYEAYPHLKDIPVVPMQKNRQALGSYSPSEGTIRMAELPTDQFHSTLMHEVQHAIQHHEGFVNGSNVEMFTAKELPQAEKELIAVQKEMIPEIMKGFGFDDPSQLGFMTHLIREEKNAPLIGGLKETYDYHKKNFPEAFKRLENIVNAEDLITKHKDEAYEMYRRTMGEVEARNVQFRRDFDDAMRYDKSPMSTQEYPNYQQIDPNLGRQ